MHDDDLPGISLRQIGGIIKGVQRYSAPGLYLPGNNGVLFDVYKWSDYESYKFTDVFELRCFPKNTKPNDDNSRLWVIKISYSRTDGESYDYVAMASKDNSTAFKRGRPGREVQTKFKLDDGCWIHCSSMIGAKRDARIAAELSVLERHLLQLDDLTQDIGLWAKSGLDMLAICKGSPCSRRAIIPNQTISNGAAKGLTLNDFQRLLACTKCRTKDPKVLPPLST
jgi:hypothetical protein